MQRKKAYFCLSLTNKTDVMNKPFLFLSLVALAGFFVSCSTKVDLYADYKDVPVIYGLIDVTQDTNYVKIVRAFSGSDEASVDATQVALIADSSNYPGKLNARIIEYKSNVSNQYEPTGREIILDTMTIHDKEFGTFYAPDQKVYYTTESFKMNTGSTKYKYKLFVETPHDTVTSETSIVGGNDFRITTRRVTFSPTAGDKTSKISFMAADNAAVYEIKMVFNYKERQKPLPSSDTVSFVDKQVSWSYGPIHIDDMENEGNGVYSIKYFQVTLFNMLSSAIGADTLNMERRIGDFEVHIAAGGNELYNFIQINSPSAGFSQTVPDYTNINGGYGVFSSRINLKEKLELMSMTQTDLINMNWGFLQR